MSNVHPFAPRRSPAVPVALPALTHDEIRRQIEEAAQSALETADRLIALLDQMEGTPDEGVASTDTLAVPETLASPVIWLRGTASDREQDSAR